MRKMRPALRAYVLAVLALGAACVAWALLTLTAPEPRSLPALAILFVLAVAAQSRPIHASAKVKFTVEDAATFAVVVAYGPAIAALVGIGSKLAAWRPGREPLRNRLFNASKLGVSLAAAGLVLQAFAPLDTFGFMPLGLLAAAFTKSGVESTAVEFAVSLQMRRTPFASWFAIHRRELALEFALYALGALAAFTIRLSPFAVVLFAIPVAIIAWAINEAVRLSRQTRSAIFQLADMVDARDPYTRGHSIRVAATAERLARRLKLQSSQVDLVHTVARVHDIGKAATDDHVLLKPAALDAGEMAEMHEHADHGATVLAALPDFYEGAELVRAHHERVDGTGYPRGLRGSEIPLEVGVVAVADAYDAMSNDRPYRRALTWAQSRAELIAGRGRQWDARIVDVFVEMMDEELAATAASPRPLAASRAT